MLSIGKLTALLLPLAKRQIPFFLVIRLTRLTVSMTDAIAGARAVFVNHSAAHFHSAGLSNPALLSSIIDLL
jgi:hypothetical protein